jgi:hypothetical protein
VIAGNQPAIGVVGDQLLAEERKAIAGTSPAIGAAGD